MKSGKTHRNRSACAQVSAAAVPRSNPQDSTVGSLPKGRPANQQGLPPSPITGGLVATCLRQGATAIIAPETLQSKVPAAPPITGGLVATCLRQGATAITAPKPAQSAVSGSTPLESEGFAGAGRASKALRSATAINAPETLQSKVPAAPPITGGLVATCLRQGATAINAPETPHSGGSSSIALGTEGPAPAINRIVRRRHADCKYCVWASFVGTGWFCALPKCIWK